MAKRSYKKHPRKPHKRLLRGYELQSILYRTAIPLSGLFAGIAGALLWLAVTAGTRLLRNGLILIAGLFTAVAALLLARAVFARRFLNAYHGIRELRAMNPFEFEHYVANLFRRLGYAARVTVASGDFGVDIVVKKGGQAAAVQCKRYAEHKYVDSPDIQRFIGSMEIYRIARGFFVATTRASRRPPSWPPPTTSRSSTRKSSSASSKRLSRGNKSAWLPRPCRRSPLTPPFLAL